MTSTPEKLSSTLTEAPPSEEEERKKWGTHIMGAPAVPSAHPDNQKAASWNAENRQQIYHQPYVEYSPIDKPSNNPLEPVIHAFNTWSTKAETIARNIWHNRKLLSCPLIIYQTLCSCNIYMIRPIHPY